MPTTSVFGVEFTCIIIFINLELNFSDYNSTYQGIMGISKGIMSYKSTVKTYSPVLMI